MDPVDVWIGMLIFGLVMGFWVGGQRHPQRRKEDYDKTDKV